MVGEKLHITLKRVIDGKWYHTTAEEVDVYDSPMYINIYRGGNCYVIDRLKFILEKVMTEETWIDGGYEDYPFIELDFDKLRSSGY